MSAAAGIDVAQIDRREFVLRSVQAAVWFGATKAGVVRRAPATSRLAVIVAGSASESPRLAARSMGVAMGIEEADHSARLFGGGVRIERAVSREDLGRLLAQAQRSTNELVGVIGGESTTECSALAETSGNFEAIYVNTLCSADELRGRSCRSAMFHVAPSDAMIADARAQASRDAPAGEMDVQAWDASLQAFGADTLNQRFRARFDTAMTSDAWAGWFAVKTLSEAILRAKPKSASALIEYLESDRATADGHKGRPLSFRAWDHQLRQPLYVVSSAEKRVVEVPLTKGGATQESRAILDELGAGAERSACHFTPVNGRQ